MLSVIINIKIAIVVSFCFAEKVYTKSSLFNVVISIVKCPTFNIRK